MTNAPDLNAANTAPQIGQPAANQLPHDVRDLIPEPWWGLSPLQLTALVVGLLLTILLSIWLWRWWQARRNRAAEKTAPIVRDPWEDLLHRVRGISLDEAFDTKMQAQFFYELSLAVREAIERRTGIAATDMTMRELREPLRQKLPLPPQHIDQLQAFLERADLVKFAEAPATKAEALAARTQTEHWIVALRPRQDAVPGTSLPAEQALQRQKSKTEP